MDDFRKITYGVIVGFVVMLVFWISFLTFTGCGSSLNCAGAAPTIERTSIPSLIPATLPPLNRALGPAQVAVASGPAQTQPAETVARPSNPGGPGPAVGLIGDVNAGKQVFVANCETCHGAQGVGGVPNPGSSDGTIPPLNPIDPTLQDPDRKTYATNVDLFIEHGSVPAGPNPTRSMLPWGDKGLLTGQQIADVIAYIISLNPVSASATAKPTTAATGAAGTQPAATPEIARPSNPGGPGPAVGLTGDAKAGNQVFAANCETCHGAQGIGGVPNPGSSDGTIPPLNPIDSTLKDSDYKVFATNLDLFIEHGSTPEGVNPTRSMLPWGEKGLLTPQQIADVIAFVISLNQ